jgi:hypothetical protein
MEYMKQGEWIHLVKFVVNMESVHVHFHFQFHSLLVCLLTISTFDQPNVMVCVVCPSPFKYCHSPLSISNSLYSFLHLFSSSEPCFAVPFLGHFLPCSQTQSSYAKMAV